ncbi:MAG: 4Fe-4S binding protein [Halobacteriota archaeon]
MALFPIYSKREEGRKSIIEQKTLVQVLNLALDMERCTGCGICKEVCPEEAIEKGPVGAVGFKEMEVPEMVFDQKKCSYCGVCVELCPFTALKLTENGEPKTDLIDQEGFPHYLKVAEINLDTCVRCKVCEEMCPRENAIERNVPEVTGRQQAITYTAEMQLDEEPGSENKCTYCGLCGEICDALTVEHKEATPLNVEAAGEVKFDSAECDGCKICEEICPTDSIKIDRTIAEAKLQGEVTINKDECMFCTWCAKTCPIENTIDIKKIFEGSIDIKTENCPAGCSACVEICPCNALYLPPQKEPGEIASKLEVNDDFCVLCGACVNVCPVANTIEVKRDVIHIEGKETELYKKTAGKMMELKTPTIEKLGT